MTQQHLNKSRDVKKKKSMIEKQSRQDVGDRIRNSSGLKGTRKVRGLIGGSLRRKIKNAGGGERFLTEICQEL